MRWCIVCGCTDDTTCMTDDGPCEWYSLDPPVCSNPGCIASWDHEDGPPVEPAAAQARNAGEPPRPRALIGGVWRAVDGPAPEGPES